MIKECNSIHNIYLNKLNKQFLRTKELLNDNKIFSGEFDINVGI